MQKASYTKADYAVEEAMLTIPVNVAMTSKKPTILIRLMYFTILLSICEAKLNNL